MYLLYSVLILITLLFTSLECIEDCAKCGDKPRVMCYFTSWSWYRTGIAKFSPSNINPKLCTHVLYAFAVLNKDTLTMEPADSWSDIDNRFYKQIADLKSNGTVPILALGGWDDSEGNKYSRLVNSAGARKKFISHSIKYLQQYGFMGLELDWEYPKCWQGNCSAGPGSDKKNFGVFCKELQAAYKPLGLTISAAVGASKYLIDIGYDVPVLMCALDWINVMTYDYHSVANGVTGANSPMSAKTGFGLVQSMNYWASKGAQKCKLVVGVPFYGKSFTLKDSSKNGIGAPTTGPGTAGMYTCAAGTLAYYEICLNVKNGNWHSVSTWTDSTYAYKNNQWVSYCDVGDMEDRAWLVKEESYGGVFSWALDYDDFTNACGCGSNPLLTTLNRELRDLDVPRVQCY